MKYAILLISCLAAVSCTQPTDRQKLEKALGYPSQKSAIGTKVDGVYVKDHIMGLNLSKKDARSAISSFKSEYPSLSPYSISNYGDYIWLYSRDAEQNNKKFSGKKSGSKWVFSPRS